MTTLADKINKLPEELINLIKEYVPKKEFTFTNKENYITYHSLIKLTIKNYEKYIRDIIKRDNDFVLNQVLRENYEDWSKIKQYMYKNMTFKNYFYFTINYCIENDSINCTNIINIFLKEHGLDKNIHKKNVIKYIRWKD
jgi:hypothetical protein